MPRVGTVSPVLPSSAPGRVPLHHPQSRTRAPRHASRVTLRLTHVGLDDSTPGALLDLNTDGPRAPMRAHRQGELDAITSSRFREAVRSGTSGGAPIGA